MFEPLQLLQSLLFIRGGKNGEGMVEAIFARFFFSLCWVVEEHGELQRVLDLGPKSVQHKN